MTRKIPRPEQALAVTCWALLAACGGGGEPQLVVNVEEVVGRPAFSGEGTDDWKLNIVYEIRMTLANEGSAAAVVDRFPCSVPEEWRAIVETVSHRREPIPPGSIVRETFIVGFRLPMSESLFKDREAIQIPMECSFLDPGGNPLHQPFQQRFTVTDSHARKRSAGS